MQYKTWELVTAMLIDLFSYLPLFFHVYFNIRNIDFKLYLREILKGYGLLHKYPQSSNFISIKSDFSHKVIDVISESRSERLEEDSDEDDDPNQFLLIEDLMASNNSVNESNKMADREEFMHLRHINRMTERMRTSNMTTDTHP